MNNHTPEYCQAPGRPYIVGRNPETKQAIIFRPPCDSWACPYCAEVKSKSWQLNAFKGVTDFQNQGVRLSFVTLTSRGGKGRTRDRSIDSFRLAFPKLARRVKYQQGDFEYIAIPEQHKNGIVHLHMIATGALSLRWWKDNAFYCGLGYIAHVRDVEHGGAAARYVSKYVGKDFIGVQWPKGYRRVRASQNWPRLEQIGLPEQWDYEVFRDWGALNWEAHYLEDLGYLVKWSETALN